MIMFQTDPKALGKGGWMNAEEGGGGSCFVQ
jgi:hypothetical protein